MTGCSSHRAVKIFRIIASLVVIGLGIYYRTWLGALGVFTLISAFNGTCPLSIPIRRSSTASRDD